MVLAELVGFDFDSPAKVAIQLELAATLLAKIFAMDCHWKLALELEEIFAMDLNLAS